MMNKKRNEEQKRCLKKELGEEKGTEGNVQRGCEVVGGEGWREGGGERGMDG